LMLVDMTINGKVRKVVMQAPKDGFFYVLDRLTGELLSAEPWVTVSWASGVNLKTGRPTINPEAMYIHDSVNVMPGPGGGHVWPPWSYNPTTGLVYIPATVGKGAPYAADPKFVPASTDIGQSGKGQMNMGMAFGPGRRTETPPPGGAHADVIEATSAPKPPAPSTLPAIGPAGKGNMLIAWDPIAGKERWRGVAAAFNQGGTLSAGNLVFASANDKLMVYRADNGDQLAAIQTGLSIIGPPMTFMIDGKQYVALSGSPANTPNVIGSDSVTAPGPPQPSRLVVFALDGKASLPKPAGAASN